MLRTLLALAGLLLLAPATVSATPFGELPFQPVTGLSMCLQATGAPGELVRQTETTAQFLTAGPEGLTAGGVLPTEGAASCVDVAGWPGGGGIMAFPVVSRFDGEVWMRGFIREPGQGWGEAIDMLPPETDLASAWFTVAASERGDALAAESSIASRGRMTVQVARRLPGGAFGAPERLVLARTAAEDSAILHAGYSASGEAIVTWSIQGPKEEDALELWAAIAAPGAPFGAPQRVAPIDDDTPYALAVGADGRALVVFTSGKRLVAAERSPGGAFGTPSTLARDTDPLDAAPMATLRPGGGAVVAWTSPLTAGLHVRTREQAGAFGPARTLAGPQRLEPAALMVQQRFVSSSYPEPARATSTPDGRVLLTWGQLTRRQGIWMVVPGAAVVDFSGAERETHALGGALRGADAGAITPVVLADGSRAVAWTDSGPDSKRVRVHLAREGTPDAAEPAAPAVKVTALGSRALKRDEPLRLRVTCSAACDVFAQLAGQEAITDSLSLPAAGSRVLELRPLDNPIAPRRPGVVRVELRSGAPGAHRATARTLSLKLRRARLVFPPRALDVTVTPDGNDLVVRWRTEKPASPKRYDVWAVDDDFEPYGSKAPEGKSPRTTFVARLKDVRGATKVIVYALGSETDTTRQTVVRVKG